MDVPWWPLLKPLPRLPVSQGGDEQATCLVDAAKVCRRGTPRTRQKTFGNRCDVDAEDCRCGQEEHSVCGRWGVTPTPRDQNPCAKLRRPLGKMRRAGRSACSRRGSSSRGCIVAVQHPARQPVLAQKLPDILDRVQLRALRRQIWYRLHSADPPADGTDEWFRSAGIVPPRSPTSVRMRHTSKSTFTPSVTERSNGYSLTMFC